MTPPFIPRTSLSRISTLTILFSPRTIPTIHLWLHLHNTATLVVPLPRISSSLKALSRPRKKRRTGSGPPRPPPLRLWTVVSLPHGPRQLSTKQDHALTIPLNPSPDSELYWSPWLYSDIVIPDHPSGNLAHTCSLPLFPHCPGPLLASDPPPVHRPGMSSPLAKSTLI